MRGAVSAPAKVRRPRAELDTVAQSLEDWATAMGCPWSFGGSWRRGRLVVGDLDVVLFVPTLWGVELPAGFRAERAGPMIVQGWLEDVRVDLWACPESDAGPFLSFVTGPADLNVFMRGRAKALGYKLGQNQLHGYAGPVYTEEQLADALGLPYLLPENRDDWRRVYMAPRGDRLVAEVVGSKGDQYQVRQARDGSLSCTCRGFYYRRQCRHISPFVVAAAG